MKLRWLEKKQRIECEAKERRANRLYYAVATIVIIIFSVLTT